MVTLWDDIRAQVAAAGERDRAAAWAAPEPWDFRRCKVLAFDPSLSSTGWVHLRVSRIGPQRRFAVLAKGTLRVRTAETGYMATYDKASRMRALMQEVLWAEQHYQLRSISDIAWEAPAVHGHRLESSLIAGLLLYDISGGAGTVISANHASKLLTGDPSHDKHAIAAAVARYVPQAETRHWNEHERDALAIGLTYSLDLPEEAWLDDDEELY